ncbi:MAG: HAMP domain-containing protein [Syntrophobacter sp.]
MKIEYKGSLQRTMIIYFLLMSFASLLITVEFVFDVHGSELRSALIQNFQKLSLGEILPDTAFQPVQALRNKAILMVALSLIVVLVLLTMFIKNITEPLQHMIKTSRLIAAGDLSQTVQVRARNELAEMGNTVNDLTSNLQEMLLLSGDMCASVDQFTHELSDALKSPEMDHGKAENLQRGIQMLESKTRLMKNIMLNCKFYGIGR